MNKDHFPEYRGKLEYFCLGCNNVWPADDLLYACPKCKSVLLLRDTRFNELKKITGSEWQSIFDARQSTHLPALRGIFRFYELIAPILDEKDIVYLGEGSTPVIEASESFREKTGFRFAFKNEGQNPSASFKDRGMACAFSYLRWLCRKKDLKTLLAICASTGDTSAACALYGAYVGQPIKTVVLLPQGKVTPQQLSQPLGSGALVLEMPGVFDDCMRVVENLAEAFPVALLNSKNSWRILGQESYAYEVAQWHRWKVKNLAIFVPIGNAGNITAIMNGFLKLHELNITDGLPRIFGAQSSHANPVFKYFSRPENSRQWKPVKVKPSVAQAAMIGNPVSFPRVRWLAEKYVELGGEKAFQVIQVEEQAIIEAMLEANRHGHIACTQGGECLAALNTAIAQGLLESDEYAVLDSTAHAIKFSGFQEKYFNNDFESAYEIKPQQKYKNDPHQLTLEKTFTNESELAEWGANEVARILGLARTKQQAG